MPALESVLEDLERAGVLLMVTSRRLINARLAGPLKLNLQSLGQGEAVSCSGHRQGQPVSQTQRLKSW